MQKLILNSPSLYQSFSDLYKSFFVNYSLILSSPGGVILSGAFSHQYGGLGLHYKIPLRNYLGIKPNNTQKLSYKHFGTYDILKKEFVSNAPLDGLEEKLNYFWERYKEYSGENIGIEVGIFNEIPRRHGLNSPGVNAANLAIAFLLLTGQIDEKILSQYQKSDEIIPKDKSDLIEKITKEFHERWIGPNNSGFGALACLKDTSAPIVYQMNERPIIKPLDEIFQFSESKETPYDIIVIGTADRSDIDFRLHSYDHVPDTFLFDKKDISNLRNTGFVFNTLKEFDNNYVTDQYRRAIDASAIASTIFMGHFLKDDSDTNQNKFFHSLNNSYNSLGLIDDKFSRKAKVSVFIQEFFYTNLPDIPFALTTSIANNLVLFVLKEHFRNNLNKLIDHLKNKLNFAISYPYISWRDGIEKNGLVIEQWEDHGISSGYFPDNSLYLKILNSLDSTSEVRYVDTKESLINANFDIIFNKDDKKVLIKGQKLTSKDLPSIPATNQLIDILLSKCDLIVDSIELPKQSYFQDRNELQSKIVSPLKELTEKYLGKTLNIKITGEITKFKVSLLPSNLSIALLKRK